MRKEKEKKISTKDLEMLKNLPDFASKINKNMQTVDNIITNKRELNSSVGSLNSSNNALRAIAHSKGKNRQTNIEDCIDIKNIVRNSVQGINGIFDNEKISEKQNNPLSVSYNSDKNSSRINNFQNNPNQKETTENKNENNLSTKDLTENDFISSKSNPKGKINNKKNYKFEPIEEENNLLTNDLTTNNLSNFYIFIFNLISRN